MFYKCIIRFSSPPLTMRRLNASLLTWKQTDDYRQRSCREIDTWMKHAYEQHTILCFHCMATTTFKTNTWYILRHQRMFKEHIDRNAGSRWNQKHTQCEVRPTNSPLYCCTSFKLYSHEANSRRSKRRRRTTVRRKRRSTHFTCTWIQA